MRKILAGLVFLLLSVTPAHAAAGCQDRIGGFKQVFEVVDKVIPNASLTDEATSTVLLDLLTIANETSGAITLTIQDRQGTVVEFMKSVSIAANTTYVIAFGVTGKKFTNGISWQASGAGLNGSMYGCKAP